MRIGGSPRWRHGVATLDRNRCMAILRRGKTASRRGRMAAHVRQIIGEGTAARESRPNERQVIRLRGARADEQVEGFRLVPVIVDHLARLYRGELRVEDSPLEVVKNNVRSTSCSLMRLHTDDQPDFLDDS